MFTFQDQTTWLQKKTGDYSAERKAIFQQDLNEGATLFMNRLARKFNKEFRTTDIKAGQQYYQLPYDVLRPSGIRIKSGSIWYGLGSGLTLISSEDQWNGLNMQAISSSAPQYVYIRGANEIGIWPIPTANVVKGLEVSHEPQHVDLAADDFTTGKLAVTNGSVTITHSATGFKKSHVGMHLQVSGDGKDYRIAGYVSTSVMSLENYYEGDTVAISPGVDFRIGPVMKIPKGYQKAPCYYAMEQHELGNEDEKAAATWAGLFQGAVEECKETYGRSTSRMGVRNNPQSRQRKGRGWIDLQPPVTYP
jgi:hypothetical protein